MWSSLSLLWEYPPWISLWWWLIICHLGGNLQFQIPQKVFRDLFQRSHSFVNPNHLKTWLPNHWYPFPLHSQGWMPCKQQSTFPQFYQTHVFAKLHEQNKTWLRLIFFIEQQWKAKDWMQWQLLQSFWCWLQSSFWQVMQMHSQAWALLLEIKFRKSIGFNLKNKWTIQWMNQVANQFANRPNERIWMQSFQVINHQNE